MINTKDVEPAPHLAAISDDIRRLADYERLAPDHISPASWLHIQSGAGAEISLSENRRQFEKFRLLPRVLRDLSDASTSMEILGLHHAVPILLAPVAYHRIVHAQGELATISAATALNTSMVVSTLSSVPLEDIAVQSRSAAAELATTAPPLWFQLYFQPDRDHSAALVRRAEAAGYQVLVVTIDASVKRSDFRLPEGVDAANLRDVPGLRQNAAVGQDHILFGTDLTATAPTWETLKWLRGITALPIVVKGVLSPEDALLAVNCGANGIIVSNHGGRVLDGLVSPLDMLPKVVAACPSDVPVMMDGGVRSGTDAFKALALGASAVMVGRPQLHALAVAGVTGVAHMLHIIRAELELTMAVMGCRSVTEITRDLLVVA